MIRSWPHIEYQNRLADSKVREVFTPRKPISSQNLFVGREREITKILDGLNTPGAHIIVYGERGVGKSSFANIACQLYAAQPPAKRVVRQSCDSDSTFVSIFTECLRSLGIATESVSTTEDLAQTKKAGLKVYVAEGGLEAERKTSISRVSPALRMTPSSVAAALDGVKAIIVIDEFEALPDKEDRRRIAELVKQLSDRGSSVKLLMVGIAHFYTDLLSGHPSSIRALQQVKLGLMPERELRSIIENGLKIARLRFSAGLINQIVDLSAGYPYFTHLLALKCAEIAVLQNQNIADEEDLSKAIELAVDEAEETLKTVYLASTRSSASTLYQNILESAALFLAANPAKEEFTAADLRNSLGRRMGRPIEADTISDHLRRLVGNDGTKVFRRVGRGVYRFTDPRMKSFVLIAMRRYAS